MVEIITCVCVIVLFFIYYCIQLTDNRGRNPKYEQYKAEAAAEGRKVPFWKTYRGRKLGARITIWAMFIWILGIGIYFVRHVDWSWWFVPAMVGLMLGGLVVILILSKLIGFDISVSAEDLEYSIQKDQKIIIERKKEARRNRGNDDPPFIPPVFWG